MTVYFAHIGKTAGTSVRKGAYSCFGIERCVCLYGRGMSGNTPDVDTIFHDLIKTPNGREGASSAVLAHISEKQAQFFSTHHNQLFGPLFAPEKSFTFLRDPVARVVSNFNFWKSRGKWDDDFEAFLADPKTGNVQANTVKHLKFDQLAAVGITERFNESVDLINAKLNINLPKRHENKTRWAPWRSWWINIKTLDPALRRLAEDANDRDMALYDRALSRMETHLQQVPGSTD